MPIDYDELHRKRMELGRQQEEELDREHRRRMELGAYEEGARPWTQHLAEIIPSIGTGIGTAIGEAVDFAGELASLKDEYIGQFDLNPFNSTGKGFYISPSEYAELQAEDKDGNVISSSAEAIEHFVDNHMYQPESMTGKGAKELARFVSGWYMGGAALKGAKVLQGGGRFVIAGRAAAQGAVADLLVYDGHEERASDFLKEFDNPMLNNIVTQYLAVNHNDSELEGRMKNVLEGAGLGLLAEGFMRSLRAMKVLKRTKEGYNNWKLRKEDRKMLDEMDDTPLDIEDTFGDDSPFQPRDIVPEARTVSETTSKPGSPFRTVVSDDGTIQVLPTKKSGIQGGMNVQDRGEFLQSQGVGLHKDFRQQGHGTRAILEGASYAASQGKYWASDTELTEGAYQLYKKLANTPGYDVRENVSKLVDGKHLSANGKPVFEIHDFPGKADAAAKRVNVKRTRLSASVDKDAIARSVARIVETGGSERLVKALETRNHKAVMELMGEQQHYIDWDSFADDPKALLDFAKNIEEMFEKVIREAKGGTVAISDTVARGLRVLEEQTGGTAARTLFDDVTRNEGLAARVFAGQQLLAESRANLRVLAEAAAGGDERAGARLLQNANAHAVLEAQVTGATSEIARAMRAMQVIKKNLDSPLFDFEEMLRDAGVTGDTTKLAKQILSGSDTSISKTVNDHLRVTVGEKLLAVRAGNLLSAPTTLIINTLGNVSMAAWDFTMRHVAFGVGGVQRALGRQARAGRDELAGYYVGIGRGLKEAFMLPLSLKDYGEYGKLMNWRGVRSGDLKQMVLDDEHVGNFYKALLTGEPQADVISKSADAGASVDALSYSLPADIRDRNVLEQAVLGMRWAVENSVGKFVRVVRIGMVSTDEVFKAVAANGEKYSSVYHDANKLRSLDPRRSAASYADEILDGPKALHGHQSNQLQKITERSLSFAREQTFQRPLSEGGVVLRGLGELDHWFGKHPWMRMHAMFFRTSVNIAVKSMELSGPAALLSRRFREELAAGGARQNKALAQLGATSGLMYMIWEKVAAGELVGRRSDKNSKYLDGVGDYSMKMGDNWVEYDRLDPFGMMIGLWTDVFTALQKPDLAPGVQQEGESLIWSTAAAFSSNILNKTYMRSLSELVDALSFSQAGGKQAFERYGNSFISSLFPVVGSNFERRRAAGQEEFAKYIFDWKDEWISRIASDGGVLGMIGYNGPTRSDLGTRMDPLGRPVKTKEGITGGGYLWDPIHVTQESDDPLMQALSRLDFGISMPNRILGGVKLTGQQYSKYVYMRGQEVKLVGRTLEESLRSMVSDPLFRALPPEGQQEAVNDEVRRYGRAARDRLLAQDEALSAAVGENRALARQAQQLQLMPEPSTDDADDAADVAEELGIN